MSEVSIIASDHKRHLINYFAYGSNLLTKRLCARTPSAQPLARGRLHGHSMAFAKRSTKDGSAKCTIIRSSQRHAVYGVVFTMLAVEKRGLDRVEGLGYGYDQSEVTVQCGDREVVAFTYIAPPERLDFRLKPYDWYRDLVLWGAREHSLPNSWVDRIRATDTVPDPDETRAIEHRAIIVRALGTVPQG